MALRSQDTISAREGVVFVTIDGQTFEFAELKNLEAISNLIVSDVRAAGKRVTGTKVTGLEYEGSATWHYHRPEIRKIVQNYAKTGIYPDITIKATNADVSSKAGRHSVMLKGVVFMSSTIFAIDGDSDDTLEDESDIRFEDFDILETFKAL